MKNLILNYFFFYNMNKVNRFKAGIHAISHIVRENLTGNQFPEEFSNLTEFSDNLYEVFQKSKHKLHFIESIRIF